MYAINKKWRWPIYRTLYICFLSAFMLSVFYAIAFILSGIPVETATFVMAYSFPIVYLIMLAVGIVIMTLLFLLTKLLKFEHKFFRVFGSPFQY